MRADARRNRERVLEAAGVVFASKGPAASTEEVAAQAGVAIGTVFRHFPTKEALIEAVFVERLRRLAAEADAMANEDDPGAAFFKFFAYAVEQSATKYAFTEGGQATAVQSAISLAGKDLHEAMGRLLTRAQHAGAVRDDVRIPEVVALLIGAARAVEHGGTQVLPLVLDGLRPR